MDGWIYALNGQGVYVSLADYRAMSETEVSLREHDLVELLKVGCAGWWFVKLLGNVVVFYSSSTSFNSIVCW